MTLQLTGRVIVYTNQVPYEADVLRTNLYKMNDISTLAQTILGTGLNNATLVYGAACTQTGPPSLAVNIAPCTIYQNEEMDATAYGVLGILTPTIYKQGINLATTLIPNLNPPGTVGQSVYYLIEAQLLTSDQNVISRPYFNSANPINPIFISQPDTRVDSVNVIAKMGIPGVTPAIPTPDAGYVGLWTVLVANGATTIMSGDIAQYSGAPFITESLTQKISQASADLRYAQASQVQANSFNYAADTGAADAYVAALNPVPSALSVGMLVDILISNTNITSAPTLNLNGFGAANIITTLGVNANPGDLTAGVNSVMTWNGTAWVLLNPQSCLNRIAYAARVRNVAGQSVGAGKLVFDTTDFDAYGIFDGTDNRFIPQIPGTYRVTGIQQGTTSNGLVYGLVYLNGSPYQRIGFADTGGTFLAVAGSSTLVVMNGSTDYVEFFTSCSPSMTSFQTFEIEYVGR